MFKCKVCIAKDEHISDLRRQVKALESQLYSPIGPNEIPLVMEEADGIMSARQNIVEIPDSQKEEFEKLAEETDDIIAERDRILSGNY